MLCKTKSCSPQKSGMEKLSTFMMFTGGLLATVYFGYCLMEKVKCRCHEKPAHKCHCENEPVDHEYDHVSENDSLCHDKKDYYSQCGCFDTEDGNPPICDDKESEELC